MIGKFGGVEGISDGSDNFQVDSNLNVKYIAADVAEVTDTLEIPVINTKIDEEMFGPEEVINDGSAYIHQTAVRQPPGECDPESDLPCSCPRRSFTHPPDQLPMPATKSNIQALENWIRTHFKESAFNQCERQP